MNVPDLIAKNNVKQKRPPLHLPWVWDVLLIGVLLIGAYFRFVGVKWDSTYHLHPDERFLTMVETAISPATPDQYFDTSASPLNPNNRGYTYYVYGTLPLFITRYVGEWLGMTGYDQINVVGRVLSGIFDMGTVLMVYLIGKRLYRNSRLGLLAALFSAVAVLQIQLSHYFAVDTFANFFCYAAIYFAARIITSDTEKQELQENPVDEAEKLETETISFDWLKRDWGSFTNYALFGLMFGMAMASKVSIWPLALLLPLAAFLFYKKINSPKRDEFIPILLRNLVLAGIIAFLTFRIFQPYAFMGPGFLGLKINQNWLNNLKELSAQSTGDVDVPFALQWARRPITFAWTNMVKWGLGIPLGVLAWAGFLVMGWRMIKGDWQKHLLLWSWIAFIFVSQSMNWVRAMRYQLPVYPGLAIIASWAIFKLWESSPNVVKKISIFTINWKRTLAVTAAILTVAASIIWAFAFTRIYTRPVTRVSASEWIYEHVAGAMQIQIDTGEGTTIQPISYRNGVLISSEQPLEYGFTLDEDAKITGIRLEHVGNQQSDYPSLSMVASIVEREDQGNGTLKAAAFIQSNFQPTSDSRGDEVKVTFDNPASIQKGKVYTLSLEIAEPQKFVKAYGSIELTYEAGGQTKTKMLPPAAYGLTPGSEFSASFIPQATGVIKGVALNRIVDQQLIGDEKVLEIYLVNAGDPSQILAQGKITDTFLPTDDTRGDAKWVEFDRPVALDSTQIYTLHFMLSKGTGSLAIYNDATAIESTWDDPLPLQINGYNAFGYDDGIYGNIQNFEMYWDDNAAKLQRFENILDQTDVIFITSNRQWGTTVRVPERYPLTVVYYRSLLGCPDGKDLLWCYQVAEPDMFESQLGFELEAVFQSDPSLGNIQINDQSAEEAFTVYDHPKVLIFRKTADYDSTKVHALLESVDLSKAVHLTPRQAGKITGTLSLSASALTIQQSGGTWKDLFDPDSFVNKSQTASVVIWYLSVLLLGWMVYPTVRLALKHLPDRGYPFSRLVGLLLTAMLTYWAGSSGLSFSRATIAGVLALLFVVNGLLAVVQRKELAEDWKTKKRYFLIVEILFLLFFALDLWIRYQNPDLWHPWRGGEKPMDFSYFNAVLKSTTFPPYDPWYAGGYINYYYYGFVIVGVLVKFLGITPSVAYNLILPTLFGLVALGAFSIGWNFFAHTKNDAGEVDEHIANRRAWFAGIASSAAVLIIGNLGTLKMIWQGLQKLVAPNASIEGVTFFQHVSWVFQGLSKMLAGTKLPYGYGDWMWLPSRALPGDTITEFPFFTFIYADLHAHMISLPITLLAIAWAISIVRSRWDWWKVGVKNGWLTLAASLIIGGVVIGALRPTNTWDYPTYLILAAVFIAYTIIRYAKIPENILPNAKSWVRKCLYAGIVILILAGLTYVFYYPFIRSYGQAYGSIDVWQGDRSPFWNYITHWGLFLFILISWMVWETREWLAATPVSALNQVKKYSGSLQTLLVLFAGILLILVFMGVEISWVAFPMAVWALILMLRPEMPDVKRIVLFMIGTGLVVTLFVELFALEGDIGRMNMVFKFYNQAWTIFALSSAAALTWLIPAVTTRWKVTTSSVWQVVLAVLVFGAALYPLTATKDKIRDRIDPNAAKSLDGAAYMSTSSYQDQNATFMLGQDYDGIRWMQQNVVGSPAIVEGNTVEYRWGNRYTIYTGLPGVLGWNYHQRQQRGFLDYNGINDRLNEIPAFYGTTDIQQALNFLQKYNVKYIILGQLERAYYPGDGLLKFEQYDGVYWKSVFSEDQTVIYEVIH